MTESILALPDGIHRDVDPKIYHQRHRGLVSKSVIDLVRRSPAHYKAWLDETAPDEDTPALRFGQAFHCALLEPERYALEYATEPEFGDCRRKGPKDARDAWRAENSHLVAVSFEDAAAIDGMMASIRRHPLASKMIKDGESELTLKWKDSETGLTCKSRLDYYVESLGMIVDAKSTLDARWDPFRRDMIKYGYEVQDALYRSAAIELGLKVQHFVFLAVEKVAPFAVATYTLDEAGIASGFSKASAAMRELAHCVATDTWPGYDVGIQTIDWPTWAA
jgi:hypothetical protein